MLRMLDADARRSICNLQLSVHSEKLDDVNERMHFGKLSLSS